ncbi:MAG: hypothetical protein ACT4N2_08610 [Hyphomicrobium sp.]
MLSAVMAAILAGCASSNPASFTTAGEAPGAASAPGPTPGYVLSEEEKGADCKRLTGRMKVRLLQIRDFNERAKTSELSRSLHTAQSQFGGSASGSNPDAEYARDRAMLDAYNGQLAVKGCKTLDLDAELKPQPGAAKP